MHTDSQSPTPRFYTKETQTTTYLGRDPPHAPDQLHVEGRRQVDLLGEEGGVGHVVRAWRVGNPVVKVIWIKLKVWIEPTTTCLIESKH